MRIRHLIILLATVGALASAGACSSGIDLEVGQCFNDPEDLSAEISDIDPVDCAEPHDNEVAFVGDLEGDDFPGVTEVQEQAAEVCADKVADYVDGDLDEFGLAPFPIYPTQEAWDSGNKRVICGVYQANLDKIEGTIAELVG